MRSNDTSWKFKVRHTGIAEGRAHRLHGLKEVILRLETERSILRPPQDLLEGRYVMLVSEQGSPKRSIVYKAGSLRDKLVTLLNASYPRLLAVYPLHQYVEYLDAYPEIASYLYMSREVKEYCDSISRESSTQALEMYHKLVLLTLILRAQEQLKPCRLPLDIKSLYEENFERIVLDIQLDSEPSGFYLYPRFCKELALCALRLIPAGAQKICHHGLPRRYFLRKKPGEFLTVVRLLLDLKGFKPIYEMHTDSRDLKAMLLFTPKGWMEFYRRVAALLELYPTVKGLSGNGWFFDPQLEYISPELAYLRQLAVHNGGTVLCLGRCNANGIQDAIRFSPTRKQLYLNGKYMPTNYLVVWPRKRLIAWAHSHR
jgi:hypothetical protein